jgi:hypothetical protein
VSGTIAPVNRPMSRLPLITTIEEGHLLLLDQLVKLLRREVLTTAGHPLVIHGDFVGSPKSDEFLADANLKPGKIAGAASVTPLEVNVSKRRKLTSFSPIFLDR